MKLCIMRCTKHGYWGVSIDGEGSGYRITPSKCCGSWTNVKEWNLSATDWRTIEREAKAAAEELERAND